jgi:hypothetical protein
MPPERRGRPYFCWSEDPGGRSGQGGKRVSGRHRTAGTRRGKAFHKYPLFVDAVSRPHSGEPDDAPFWGMTVLQKYLSFWSAWFSWWTIIISLEFAIYQIAIADGSKVIARSFVQSSRAARILSHAFYISSELTNVIFGPFLVSWRAFFRSCFLSGVVFIIALLVAIATTSNWPANTLEWFFSWSTPADPPLAHGWAMTGTFSLILFWLVFEFLYVIKSRWLIRFIGANMKWYSVIVIFETDISTTLLLLIIIGPLPLLIFGTVFLHAAGAVLNHHFIDVGSYLLEGYDPLKWFVYRDMVHEGIKAIVVPLRGDFTYHVLQIGSVVDPDCRFQYSGVTKIMELVQCHSSVMYEDHVTFPLTTMIVSALATAIWMTTCATTLLVAKAWNVPRKAFLWFHDNPTKILTRGILPTIVISIVGGLLIPVLVY